MPDQDTYDLGTLEGTIAFNLPQSEQRKLDALSEQAPEFGDMMSMFSRGAAAFLTTAAAITTVMFAGEGFGQVFGMLGDLLGMLSDLLFVALFPMIEPLLEAFIEFGRDMAEMAQGEGGILGAIMSGEFLRTFLGRMLEGIKGSLVAGGEILIGILTQRETWTGVFDPLFKPDNWKKVGGWIWSGMKGEMSLAGFLGVGEGSQTRAQQAQQQFHQGNKAAGFRAGMEAQIEGVHESWLMPGGMGRSVTAPIRGGFWLYDEVR